MSEHKDRHEESNTAYNSDNIEQHKGKRLNFKRSHFILLLLATVIITTLITVFVTIGISNWKSGLNSDQRAEMKKVQEVYKTLNNEYYKNTDSEKLSEAAINGMVKNLNDPYSDYMTKKETKSFNEDVSGDFVGIGAEMQQKGDKIEITSPMKSSPAEKAGIQPKDVVTKVDGKSIKGLPLEAIVKKIRGKKGTDVTLTINRGGQTHDITIERDKIHVKSVEYEKQKGVGVFTINKFQESTASELKTSILKAHKDGVSKIVLDLRNNPGGLLDEAVKMANIFIDKGKTIVQLEKGDHKEKITASNDALKEAKDMDVSILVNKGSASASEVFTGAMMDYDKAKVYGTKTFGKGIVQTTHEFNDGSLLKFTNMKWLTPKSHYIHNKGIKPDVKLNIPEYQTLNVIPDDKTYKLGDNNKNVKTMKIGLSALGHEVNNSSNEFDNALQSAIKSFQKENDLDVNGKFDKETNKKFTQQLVDKANKEDTVLQDLLKKLN
ncbi:MAG TPA: S41 family peptidase [Staphylococcus sp.]|nr:S41 family peptidase [Staphylococcus sp.]